MDDSTLCVKSNGSHELTQEQVHSCYELFKQIEDPRAARGKQYELAGLLMVLLLAKLAGMKSLLGASDWVRDQAESLQRHLNLPWKQMPCANTYKYALARLQSQQVNGRFRDWLVRQEAQSRCGAEPSRLAAQENQRAVHVAIDGKVLKGTGKQTYGGEQPQQHVLHVYEVKTGIVLHQCPIADKENEVSALKPLLREVLCKGRILTADAAQSYHDFGRLVKRAGEVVHRRWHRRLAGAGCGRRGELGSAKLRKLKIATKG